MKTTKFVLIAAILSFALMSFTTNEPCPFGSDPGSVAVKMSLRTAMQNPGLVLAMHAQIDRSILQGNDLKSYVAHVRYNRVSYTIYGSRAQWQDFFSVYIGNNDPPEE